MHASGESGSVTALASLFQEPYLFESAVVANPVTDLVSHLMLDIENRSYSRSRLEHDIVHYDKLEEFGDVQNKLFYEMVRTISPYHMPVVDKEAMHTDLMLCVDDEFVYKYHARKLMCKLRDVYGKDNSFAFYKEYGAKAHT